MNVNPVGGGMGAVAANVQQVPFTMGPPKNPESVTVLGLSELIDEALAKPGHVLNALDLSDCSALDLADFTTFCSGQLTDLRKLNLSLSSDAGLDEEEIPVILRLMRCIPTLTKLDLSGRISENTAEKIREQFKHISEPIQILCDETFTTFLADRVEDNALQIDPVRDDD